MNKRIKRIVGYVPFGNSELGALIIEALRTRQERDKLDEKYRKLRERIMELLPDEGYSGPEGSVSWVQQERYHYDPDAVMQALPQELAEAVIKRVVEKRALEGLAKSGAISEETLDRVKVVERVTRTIRITGPDL